MGGRGWGVVGVGLLDKKYPHKMQLSANVLLICMAKFQNQLENT